MTRWIDFSGAPPILVPVALAMLWRGALDPGTGEFRDLNTREPRTDYDRACAAAWPGRGRLPLGNASALVLYSEYDEHTWDSEHGIIACGGWLPTPQQIASASWTDPLRWNSEYTDYLLMNSAAAGAALREDEYMMVTLPRGECLVEYASIEAEYVGCFHRIAPAGVKRVA